MLIKRVNGRKIDVKKIVVEICSDGTDIIMEIVCDNNIMVLEYKNISCLNISNENALFVIEGFGIIDHLIDGWCDEQRYEVKDYENDMIHFYCEQILDITKE